MGTVWHEKGVHTLLIWLVASEGVGENCASSQPCGVIVALADFGTHQHGDRLFLKAKKSVGAFPMVWRKRRWSTRHPDAVQAAYRRTTYLGTPGQRVGAGDDGGGVGALMPGVAVGADKAVPPARGRRKQARRHWLRPQETAARQFER
jgi:hypothetical protein